MFGLQKQRRNAAGGGAWFIAGHLTVFAKLSHHAVPLESRIFSSRCFSFSVPPLPFPSPLTRLVPPTADSCTSPPPYVTIRRRQRTFMDPRRHKPPPGSRNFLRKIRSGCERISEFPWPRKHKFGRARETLPEFFRPRTVYSSHNFCSKCEKKDGNTRHPLRTFDW